MLPFHSLIRRNVLTVALMTSFVLGPSLRAMARPVINVVESGALEVSSHSPNLLETVVPAIVRVRTDEPVRLEILPGRLRNGPDSDPSGTERVVIVRYGSRQVSSRSGDRTIDLPTGVSELEVLMRIERPRRFRPGRYTYTFGVVPSD